MLTHVWLRFENSLSFLVDILYLKTTWFPFKTGDRKLEKLRTFENGKLVENTQTFGRSTFFFYHGGWLLLTVYSFSRYSNLSGDDWKWGSNGRIWHDGLSLRPGVGLGSAWPIDCVAESSHDLVFLRVCSCLDLDTCCPSSLVQDGVLLQIQ